ncbi:MAG: ribonuclease R [Nitrospirae bacterium RIFCSPLOW2_12_42_9]|nr:MAG: ribonuclease R [Nitrospirae bacterium RIFCSPLOW2_12_42_9]
MELTRDDILKLMQDKAYRPLLLKELIGLFNVSRKERPVFKEMIGDMLEKGLIVKIRGDRYGLPGKMNLITGVLQGHPDGYGFVKSDLEGEADLFVPKRNMMGAMHNDRVVARIESADRGGRLEGRIIRILERFHSRIVGRFERGKNFGFVIPSDRKISHDIYIPPKLFNKAKDGDVVVAKIIAYPQKTRNPEGEIIKVLGRSSTPGIDTGMIIEEYELPTEFPEDVITEAEALPGEVAESMLKERVDLRTLQTVTIDGERAKDFDDAVSIEKLPDGRFRLWVHIADVSYYVPWGSELDNESYNRGTSVYLPDRVIPMFPERLSNHICSLNPREDRLTLTAEMMFDGNGNRINYKIYESVINSNERMTYTAVKEILEDEDSKIISRYSDLIETFHLMRELCLKLRAKRMGRGSIDFDLPEPEIILDLQSKTINIVRSERNIAHQIIEEFMLAANETIARHMGNKEIPFIYRVHESPDEDKIMEFNEFMEDLGYKFKLNHQQPKTFQRLLNKLEGKSEETLINQLLLRSMKQARYSTENIGHFGLASEHYTHFTSPIRRYPDLIVHRLIKEVSKNRRIKEERKSLLDAKLKDIAKHSSERERLSMEAEREVVELKKLEFMQDKIGSEYDGVISGVVAFGFFVELEDILVEGLVRVTSMYDDFYRFEERQHRLAGDRTDKVYRLGDKVRVRVDKVDMEKRKIDFILA